MSPPLQGGLGSRRVDEAVGSAPITATALMKLVEQGRVDLDRPVNDYLGPAKLAGYAGDARAATVRLVAGHAAGLPLHYQFFIGE